MAKGQQKSNKETRKPKKDKKAAAPAMAVGTAVKQAAAKMPMKTGKN